MSNTEKKHSHFSATASPENNSANDLELKQELSEEESLKVKKEFEEFEGMGQIILGGSGFRVQIDTNIETLAFDHQKRAVLINPLFVEKMNLNKKERLYVFDHEVGHIVQLAQDPVAYLGTFEESKDRAKQWPRPEQQKEIKNAWHRFFNCFEDIHSNRLHENRTPVFYDTGKPDHPRRTLYHKLFDRDNFTDCPAYLQFCYAALVGAMDPSRKLEISDEVRQIMESPFSFLGTEYKSLQTYIDQELASPDIDFSRFIFRLKRSVQPIFEKLLHQDAENNQLEIQSDIYDILDFDGPIDEETLKKIKQGIEEADKSMGERAEDQMRRDFDHKMEEAGFSKMDMKRMEEIMLETGEVFYDLKDLWRVFLQFSSIKTWEKESGYKTGKDISVDEFIKQLPTLLSQPEQARIFERKVSVESDKIIKPKKINLYLAVDLSGSMDDNKRKATQEAVYALAKSLVMFRRDFMTEAGISITDKPIMDINIRVIGFGSSIDDLLKHQNEEKKHHRLSDESPDDLDNRLWRAILDINSVDLGGTEDALALSEIYQELKTIAGKSSLGVFTRGIRIPGEIYDESQSPTGREKGEEMERIMMPKVVPDHGTFEKVWGKNGERLDNLQQLKPVMKKILFDSLMSGDKLKKADNDEVAVIIEVTDGETTTEKESKKIINDLHNLNKI